MLPDGYVAGDGIRRMFIACCHVIFSGLLPVVSMKRICLMASVAALRMVGSARVAPAITDGDPAIPESNLFGTTMLSLRFSAVGIPHDGPESIEATSIGAIDANVQ